ncbi:MAG: DDE-type integrase/transposase/recombinase [Janthinobacterium lividum]
MAAANKLGTWPAATAPNQIWVGDITYLALATGHWVYLACWRDAFSRRVVGLVSPGRHLARERIATYQFGSDRLQPGGGYLPAPARESGWSTFKTELLPRGACFVDLAEARFELAEYLDHYYNTQRLYSALGYRTPLEIELHYLFNLP